MYALNTMHAKCKHFSEVRFVVKKYARQNEILPLRGEILNSQFSHNSSNRLTHRFFYNPASDKLSREYCKMDLHLRVCARKCKFVKSTGICHDV